MAVGESMSLEQAIESLQAMDYEEQILDVPGLRLGLEGDKPALEVAGARRILSPQALYDLRDNCGVDKMMFTELSDNEELFGQVVNHALSHRGDQKVRVTGTRGEILGITPTEQDHVSARELLGIIGEEFPDVDTVESIDNRRGHLTIRFLTDRSVHPPQDVDDVSHSGFWVRINGHLETASYVNRLVCTNGMMADRIATSYETGRSRQQVVAALRSCYQSSHELAQRFVHLADVQVEHPEQYLLRVARERGLGSRDTARLISHVAELPSDPTAYDVTNLVTRIARDRRREGYSDTLQWFGANLANAFHQDRCSHCGNRL